MAAHAVKQKDTVFVFKSAYEPGSEECLAMGRHLTDHGDGVKDVAFTVEDLDGIMAGARARGGSISIVSSDSNIIWSPPPQLLSESRYYGFHCDNKQYS